MEVIKASLWNSNNKEAIRQRDRINILKEKCVICKKTYNLEIHHYAYKRGCAFVVCKNCHYKIHFPHYAKYIQ